MPPFLMIRGCGNKTYRYVFGVVFRDAKRAVGRGLGVRNKEQKYLYKGILLIFGEKPLALPSFGNLNPWLYFVC